MRNLFAVATIAVVVLGAAGAKAEELPTYELMGFPITHHQFSVVGSSNIHERAPTPSLTLGGMPASPHQVAVLMPRPRVAEKAAVTSKTVGLSAR